MKKYFSFDQYNGDFTLWDTLEEAHKEAMTALTFYRDEAGSEGWPEDMSEVIGYGEVKGTSFKSFSREKSDYTESAWEDMGYSSEWDEIIDYEIKEI